MIKDEVGSVNGLGGEAQEQRLIDVRIRRGGRARYEVSYRSRGLGVRI